MDLTLALSKAGHDKNQVYVIIDELDDFYMVANGTTKPIAKPKKKKKIHLQLIKNIPSDVLEEYDSTKALDDLIIKRILKSYNRRNKDV
ncbi:RNA-binding protein [Pseudobutyrivibrio xylanivorans]|uniref:RNA-binding protein n=1 Tax=Pseudobutyrivibrio xylanivorans TaxID=185007 RepID=A0A5P6VPX4_PSEXY|nr:RNA-binding protein [Pseudobutyrivibrio xylanivorans]QFJ54743.1 RNA-binding protein [Pseudobutyrivibrio xylanivorans]